VTKIIAAAVLGLATVGLIAGVALQTMNVAKLVSSVDEIDFQGVGVTTSGLEGINLTALMPIMQIFIGKAAIAEVIQLPQATAEQVGELNLTLPPGWAIAKDASGTPKTYQSLDGTTVVVQLEDADGNSAVITKTEKPNPEGFLSDTISQISHVLEASGYDINTYTVTRAAGQEAQVIEVQQANLAIQIRGWVSNGDVYIVALNSNPENLAVSQQIFESIS